MTTTARSTLFGDGEVAGVVGRSPAWSAVLDGLGTALPTLGAPALAAVGREVAAALAGPLDLDLGAILVAGWRGHRALVRAAHATRADPGAVEVVQLGSHQVTSTHHPSVEVSVGGVTVATVRFEVTVTLDVESLAATVRRGRITEIRSGRCTATVALGAGGYDLATGRSELTPEVVVDLRDGLAILPGESERSRPVLS
jgi:hypothetical protein